MKTKGVEIRNAVKVIALMGVILACVAAVSRLIIDHTRSW